MKKDFYEIRKRELAFQKFIDNLPDSKHKKDNVKKDAKK